ncbi:hypothetical protein V1508DRAFT_435977 [Lipomyces doorenjongii]|uniref:uncharacterized protein n=1 Tax=Lipomyces doorenjongii TaxID=383834 RepID=UPI0034CFDFF4
MGYTCNGRAFVRDLLIDPRTRGVTDVIHKPVAVGSRTVEKAVEFVESCAPGSGMKAYGSYEELVKDPDVDVVYVGSLNSLHYRDSLTALRSGKHVLCEKAFTINAAQARHLASVAKENNLFLMEGVWTRFFPLVRRFKEILHEDKILGKIIRVSVDCGHKHPYSEEKDNRIYGIATGGGVLLNLGVYATMWAFLACYHHPDNDKMPPTSVKASMLRAPTGIDACTAITMIWDKPHIISVSTATVALNAFTERLVCVDGEFGHIIIPLSTPRPTQIIIRIDGNPEEVLSFPIPAEGTGLFYEADEVARDIRDKRISNLTYALEESILIVDIFDEIRRDNNLVYPAAIDAVSD